MVRAVICLRFLLRFRLLCLCAWLALLHALKEEQLKAISEILMKYKLLCILTAGKAPRQDSEDRRTSIISVFITRLIAIFYGEETLQLPSCYLDKRKF